MLRSWLLSIAALVLFAGLAEANGPATDALSILKTLRAMTTARPTHGEYYGRVAYAKSRVDVLAARVSDKALASALTSAMRFYYVAADIWTEMLQGAGSHVQSRERADDVRAVIQNSAEDCLPLTRLRSASDDELLTGALSAAWSCAADKTSEAEKLLGNP